MNKWLVGYSRAFLLASAIPVCAQAASVTRGPYLQSGSPHSVVVRWRTDRPTTSVVRYGTAIDNQDKEAQAAGVTTEHVVLLDGLKPETRHYYSVGSTNRTYAGGSTDFSFVTAPLRGTPAPIRVWVIGDPGTRTKRQRAVRDAYYRFSRSRHTDLWLMLGDNAYGDGTDRQYQGAVFEIYRDLLRQSVLWPTLGNHDARSASSPTQSGVYYQIFTLPTLGQAGGLLSGTEAYYSFDHGNIHFVCLDSHDTDRSPTGAMLTWLKHDLAATRQDWIVAYWHHPPYTKGSHDSDSDSDSGGRMNEMRANALPILEAGGADLVLTGHSHSYERSYLLDGHYGKSPTLKPAMFKSKSDGRPEGSGAYRKATAGPAAHEGTVYAVAGSSGQTSGGKLNHPVMFISLNVLGSMVLDFNGHKLDALFLDDQGASRDHFSIVKGTP